MRYFCAIYHFCLVLYSLETPFKKGRLLEINFLSSVKLQKSEEQTGHGTFYSLDSTTYHPQKYHFLFSHFLCFLALDISSPNLNCKQHSNEINGPCYSFLCCGRQRKNKQRKERHNIQLKRLVFNRLAAAIFCNKEVPKFVIPSHWHSYLIAQQHQDSESV